MPTASALGVIALALLAAMPASVTAFADVEFVLEGAALRMKSGVRVPTYRRASLDLPWELPASPPGRVQ